MMTSIRDILLYMVSYPQPTPRWAQEASLHLAEWSEARLSAVLCQAHIPAASNWLASRLIHVDTLIASENARSRQASLAFLNEFVQLVPEHRRGEQILIDHGPIGFPIEPAQLARTRDLTIVPVSPELESQAPAESLLFDSGRPILLLPRPAANRVAYSDIVIGWDGSRSAGRALAAALPFCQRAGSVRLVAVSGDKPFDPSVALGEAQRHLEYHGIASSVEEVPAGGRDAGTALLEHALRSGANLMAMGGYGHSRTREFVLGGATRAVLTDPRMSVLMAH